MPEDDFDDELEEDPGMPDEMDDDEDIDLEAEELGDDDLDDDADLDVEETDEGDGDDEGEATGPGLLASDDEEDFEDEEDEDSDDVEASLDVILKSRLVVSDDDEEDEDEEEEDEEADADERGEPSARVLPKQPGEFVCQSCFLVKHQSQLADRERELCRDCV